MVSITKEFKFDAAHSLPTAENGRPHVLGHSFTAAVTLEGPIDGATGFVRNFAEVDAAIAPLRARLDHHLLNEVKGLRLPTLERLAEFVFEELKAALPELTTVTVRRPSAGESATFRRTEKP